MALGDCNTYYFYRCAKARKIRNEVTLLQKSNGEWSASEEDIINIFLEHFKNIFRCDSLSNEKWEILEDLAELPIRLNA